MGFLEAVFGNKKEKRLFLHFNSAADYGVKASQALVELCQNSARAEEYGKATRAIEHECDQILEGVFEILDSTAMLPFRHDDIENLVKNMDSIVDCLWGAVKRVAVLYFFPELGKEKELLQIALIIQDMTVRLREVISKIKKLGRMKDILKIAKEFHDRENEVDDLCDAAKKRWHQESINDLGKLPLRIAWGEVYDRLDWAANRCVDVTDILKKIFREYS